MITFNLFINIITDFILFFSFQPCPITNSKTCFTSGRLDTWRSNCYHHWWQLLWWTSSLFWHYSCLEWIDYQPCLKSHNASENITWNSWSNTSLQIKTNVQGISWPIHLYWYNVLNQLHIIDPNYRIVW